MRPVLVRTYVCTHLANRNLRFSRLAAIPISAWVASAFVLLLKHGGCFSSYVLLGRLRRPSMFCVLGAASTS